MKFSLKNLAKVFVTVKLSLKFNLAQNKSLNWGQHLYNKLSFLYLTSFFRVAMTLTIKHSV
jgi:hypothetical protein